MAVPALSILAHGVLPRAAFVLLGARHRSARGLRHGRAAAFRLRRLAAGTARRDLDAADAADHRARDRIDARLRVALSRVEYESALYARLGPLDPARARDLGGAAADH